MSNAYPLTTLHNSQAFLTKFLGAQMFVTSSRFCSVRGSLRADLVQNPWRVHVIQEFGTTSARRQDRVAYFGLYSTVQMFGFSTLTLISRSCISSTTTWEIPFNPLSSFRKNTPKNERIVT